MGHLLIYSVIQAVWKIMPLPDPFGFNGLTDQHGQACTVWYAANGSSMSQSSLRGIVDKVGNTLRAGKNTGKQVIRNGT